MPRKMWVAIFVLVLVCSVGVAQVAAQGPQPGAPRILEPGPFTYHGQLKSDGTPYTGSCDFQFALYDSATVGTQVGITQTVPVSVTNGLFSTIIDFGATYFNGSPRYLDIGVSCPSGGSFTPLTTRQRLTAEPYALYATRAGSLVSVLAASGGGTGMSSPGSVGNYLRSSGSNWTSSAILPSDLPTGSSNYIQNTFSQQSGANFNISGSGTLWGALSLGGALNLPSTSSAAVGVLNLGGNRFLHNYGSQNTFLGSNAGNLAMTGSMNTVVGMNALTANTSGYANAAVGYAALNANTSGHDNTAIGPTALHANTTGNDNTALGAGALAFLVTGTSNVAVGQGAGYNYSGGDSSNIVISNQGTAGESNTIRIGTLGYQSRAFIAGIFGVTSSIGTPVYINSSGQLGTATSSRRFKDNIRDMGATSDILYQLRPVNFTYKPEYGGSPDQRQIGLIAEEVARVAPWMVVNDEGGQPYTVRYELLAPMLVNEIQKQQGTIQTLADENADLRAQVATSNSRLDALESALAERGVSRSGFDGLSTPMWILVGMVGFMVGQRVWKGGKS